MSDGMDVRLLMEDGTVRTLPMEEYLRGVVPVEMPPQWSLEALKAQAVAARTYALVMIQDARHADKGADLCTTEHCQAYRERREASTDEAVRQTAHQILTFPERKMYAFYSAACGGHTLNNEEAWPGSNPVPYLRGVPCPCGRPVKGHRVGMCQHGARVLAEQGKPYDQILAHYYQGTRLESIPGTATATLSLDSPVLGPATGSQEQAAAFLKRTMGHEYTAHDVDLILSYYWRFGPEAGVDPFLAVAQSIYDTGAWRAPETARPHRNPARLGRGGAPGGVQSFASWEQSAKAHIEQLKNQGEGKRLRDLHGDEYANQVLSKAKELLAG